MAKTIDLNDIRLLMQVIEHGSYTAASRAIGVPKSTISQRIAALEHTIGTGLLRRTSRSFSLTEAGVRLLPHARAIEDLAKTVEQALLDERRELAGTLRISSSHVIAAFALSSIVSRFLEQHTGVTIRVEATNRVVDIIREGFDMALRGHVGSLKDSSLIQRVVAHTPWSMVAAPSWIEKHSMPRAPDEIPPGHLLYFAISRECASWTLRREDEEAVVRVAPQLISDDMMTVRETALAGGGIACLPTYILRDAIEAGQLVTILPEWISPPSTISVLTPPRAQSSRLTRAFSDFLAAEFPKAIRS